MDAITLEELKSYLGRLAERCVSLLPPAVRWLPPPAVWRFGRGSLCSTVAVFPFHHHVRRAKPDPFKQEVEVGPFEHQFGHVVEFGVFQQAERADGRKGVLAGERFGVVVEVDDIGFPEA